MKQQWRLAVSEVVVTEPQSNPSQVVHAAPLSPRGDFGAPLTFDHEKSVPRLRTRFAAVATAAVAIVGPSLSADPGTECHSPEGFSASSEGLPERAVDAWLATVLIEGFGVVWPRGGNPRVHEKQGSGVVLAIDDRRRRAVIATNAHNVTCGTRSCNVRVGFSDPLFPEEPKWGHEVHVVSRNLARDLALIEVDIPAGAEVRPAELASPMCSVAGRDGVISIGWPDLRVRKKWGVEVPANFRDHVKRYSDGLFLSWLRDYPVHTETDVLFQHLQVVFHNADLLPGSSGGPLVDRDGMVVGLNTMVIGDERTSDDYHFCARRDARRPGECVHVAIASQELVKEYESTYGKRLELAFCPPPSVL